MDMSMASQPALSLHVLDSVSEPGAATNDDLIYHRENVAWVFDGATSLSGRASEAEATDVQWLIGVINATLPRAHSLPLTEQLEEVCATVQDEFSRLEGHRRVEKHEAPSAVGTGVLLSGESLEVVEFGDCQLILQAQTEGPLYVSPRSRLQDLDALVIAEATALAAESAGEWELNRPALMPRLRAHRNLLNTPEGYGAISVFGEYPTPSQHHRVAVAQGGHGLLVSDGFMALSSAYNALSPGDMLSVAVHEGLDILLDRLRVIESEDPHGSQFPRLKQHDDASALLFSIT